MSIEPAELRRRKQGEIISRLALIMTHALQRAYDHSSGPSPALETAMAIRIINLRRNTPASIAQIMQLTGFARTTVRNHIASLLAVSMVIEEAPSRERYSINPEYPGAKIGAPHVRYIVRAIRAAANMLEQDEQ
ncbi:hypothetical protein QIH85_23930 [Bradyrhizobium japonicum]|uniref:hypothetical protein n=1 Tax=Bradyrhizobium japonicum TaxID=375 RepID=UPI0027154B67|nr:hypothetical protein [Bradyrhizobium japonicum]WLB24933.1 hypothetical protein QIH85_23930 [Bradyrhizobium japonicum]